MAERIDDLQYNGLRILQDTDEFCFGMDAVELANFADIKPGSQTADIGAGTGVISILIAAKKGARVKAIEINPVTAALCRRSVAMNGMSGDVETYEMRAQDCPAAFGRIFDCVISNPPYRPVGSGRMHEKYSVAIARHELTLTLAELTETAAALLKTGGAFYAVYPADRLAEVMVACVHNRLQPKIIRLLSPAPDKPPHLFLLKCIYGASPGVRIFSDRLSETGSRHGTTT